MTPYAAFCRLLLLATLASIVISSVPATGQMNMNMAMDTGDPVAPEQLPPAQHIAGVGNAVFPITANAEAQAWFVQGYNLLMDFWNYEADRTFEQSIRADRGCAMCYWGLYEAESFRHGEEKSYAQGSLAKAVALMGQVTRREKLYIQAAEAHEAAIREAGSGEKAKFDHEIELLRTLVRENPGDTNARILLAEAVSDDYDDKGEPKNGQQEANALLLGVMKEEPNNSAANHIWIHAVEASAHPEQALHSAEILGPMAPASGHMVHMPGHIYYRVGDYARAQAAFDASAAADERYMRQQRVAVDNDWNYVHNLMYSVANLMEAGRLQDATLVSARLKDARGHREDTLYPWSARDSIARLDANLPVALRTGDWAQVVHLLNAAQVQEPMPHMAFLASGVAEFAEGMQAIEAHQPEIAKQHSLQLDADLWRMSQEIKAQEAEESKKEAEKGNHAMGPDPLPKPLLNMVSIMALELHGAMSAEENDVAAAAKYFAMAQQQEKDLGYHEPPLYIRPVAESEASAMMLAGNWPPARAAAERAAAERPNSGFALFLIAQIADKNGDVPMATRAYQRFLAVWKTADSTLPQVQHANAWLSQHATGGVTGTR